MDNTFIKLSRKIQSWRWYQDANTMRVFIHILLNANVYDHDFENITVKRGQWVTSQKRIAEQLNLSLKNVRTALDHLKATGEVAVKTTSKYSIITVFNYNQYQKVAHDSAVNRQSAGTQSAVNRQQYKKGKEYIKNGKKERGSTLSAHGPFKNVFLSDAEVDELERKYPSDYKGKIDRLSKYLETSGKKYNNHFAVLSDWLEKDVSKKPNQKSDDKSTSFDIDEVDTFNYLGDFDVQTD